MHNIRIHTLADLKPNANYMHIRTMFGAHFIAPAPYIIGWVDGGG